MTQALTYRKLSAIALTPHVLQGLALACARALFRRTPRQRARVAQEYEDGAWKRVRAERRWERCASLEEFLLGENDEMRIARVDGACVRIRTKDYYRHRVEALTHLMRRYVIGEEVVELGCGYGANLLSLALRGPWPRLVGLDISENAIAAGREIVQRFGLGERVRFGRVDLTAADDPGFREIAGKTAFSYFCIEQVPYSVAAVVRNILAQRPRRVIHVESAPKLLHLWRPRDLLNYLHVRSMDYQTELLAVLEKLHADGAIRIVERQRTTFAPTLHNDGFVIVWEPRLAEISQ